MATAASFTASAGMTESEVKSRLISHSGEFFFGDLPGWEGCLTWNKELFKRWLCFRSALQQSSLLPVFGKP